MRITSAAVVLIFSAPACAQSSISYPVSVPQECVELAHREGVPVLIESRYQAAKAELKLSRMSDNDPLVHQCRAAIARARSALQASNQR